MIFEDELTDDFFKETVQRVSEVFAEFGKRESSKTFSEEEKQQLIAAARKVLENCEKE